jgi:bacillithiol system protein YtxJ
VRAPVAGRTQAVKSSADAPVGRVRALNRRKCLARDARVIDVRSRSRGQPVVIFKHSATCGASAYAFDALTALLAERLPGPVYIVRVQVDRRVSNSLADRLGVRHESPQVLLLVRGEVRWTASHYRVTAENVSCPSPPQRHESRPRDSISHRATAQTPIESPILVSDGSQVATHSRSCPGGMMVNTT